MPAWSMPTENTLGKPAPLRERLVVVDGVEVAEGTLVADEVGAGERPVLAWAAFGAFRGSCPTRASQILRGQLAGDDEHDLRLGDRRARVSWKSVTTSTNEHRPPTPAFLLVRVVHPRLADQRGAARGGSARGRRLLTAVEQPGEIDVEAQGGHGPRVVPERARHEERGRGDGHRVVEVVGVARLRGPASCGSCPAPPPSRTARRGCRSRLCRPWRSPLVGAEARPDRPADRARSRAAKARLRRAPAPRAARPWPASIRRSHRPPRSWSSSRRCP